MHIKTIAIGCDHAGFVYKDSLAEMLRAQDIEIQDFGTHSADAVDYPDFAHPVAEQVESGRADLGVLICGSGNGVAITANKHQGIRCALCWNEELAALARQHNNANVIALPARFVSAELAQQMVQIFITTEFEGGRHDRRVSKIASAC
ncbi:MAG TPA: ribose 5-phosphate isomerase B [Saprospiraceae bacterium]|nr:ribose 5-phosphate isomerase B [Saprospiraceae bacterium]HMP22529.1 ribose 5-phosphate isomerase B [Saprospiraceae bacterium]